MRVAPRPPISTGHAMDIFPPHLAPQLDEPASGSLGAKPAQGTPCSRAAECRAAAARAAEPATPHVALPQPAQHENQEQQQASMSMLVHTFVFGVHALVWFALGLAASRWLS